MMIRPATESISIELSVAVLIIMIEAIFIWQFEKGISKIKSNGAKIPKTIPIQLFQI